MPILKQSGSSHSKKRSRIDRQMISAPLGDFRHTMHVGRGGDVFGDTSFLSNHGPSQPTVALASPSSPKSPKSPTSPKSPSSPKANGTPRPAVEDHNFQAGRTKAGSLSQLSQSSGIESGSGSWASSPVHYGSPKEDSSEAWSTGTSRGDVERIDWLSSSSDTGLKHAESILSFHLDLGPSIMDEVLGVMDKKAPAGDWQRIEDQFDFGFKYNNKEVDAENGHLPSPTPCADVDIPAVHYGLASPLGNDHVLDSPSSSASGTLEKNNSSYEGDSDEEKRSVYEGLTNGPVQGMASRSDAGHEDDEEVGQGYTFDDDSDDEIGV